MHKIDPSLLFLIISNAGFSYAGFQNPHYMEKYMFNVAGIRQKEYYRFFTAGFLHVDFSHLLFNMITLYFFAPVIILSMSRTDFLIIYFASLLAGNIWAYLYHKNEYNYRAVGASGAISGVLFASILLYPNMSIYLFFIPIPIPAIVVGVGYLAYSLFGMKNRWGNIGHSTHLGGAVAGLVMSIILYPELLHTHLLTLVLLSIPLAIFILFIYLKK